MTIRQNCRRRREESLTFPPFTIENNFRVSSPRLLHFQFVLPARPPWPACEGLRFEPRGFEGIKLHFAKTRVADCGITSDQREVHNFRRRGNDAVERIAGEI